VRFWLGTHEPAWLSRTSVPLFISVHRLARLKRLPRALGPLAIDSGGYSSLSRPPYRWTFTPQQYIAEVRRCSAALGRVEWCAPMDWMCEPWILQNTGLSVAEHQARTIASVVELRQLAPEIQWAPVLQGWVLDDFLRHADAYVRAGVDLARETIVGVGSVCRRQATDAAVEIFAGLSRLRLRLHGFGFKKQGLLRVAGYLDSSDSLAWSFDARRLQHPVCGSLTHKNCANCLSYALRWRTDVLRFIARARPRQLRLPLVEQRSSQLALL
jgi:hypothetical protein